ncbi:MAG: DUF1559 domain-containing protein [Zavarzinella sp.]|nr:DUF1559 domain-containing protein [Zavarzinella sp.]
MGIALGVALGFVVAAATGIYQSADQTYSHNNLLQLGYAIHNFDANYGHLPHNTYAADGTPLLSWRVHLLPMLEQDALYRRFRLDEPWDSPANYPLLKEMPRVFARPMTSPEDCKFLTHYRGFSNPGAVFERRPGDSPLGQPDRFGLGSFRDGRANTILVVEAADPVEWTKPDDLDASPGKPFPKLGGLRRDGVFQAVMGNVVIRRIPLDTPEDKLRALVTHSGGEPVTPD